MEPGEAETLALQALAWIAGEDERLLTRFMDATGARPGDLTGLAGEPVFLGAVLDFLLSEESQARRFASDRGMTAETLHAARAALPGGASPHWT